MSCLAQAIVKLSHNEVGVEEIDGTNCGPRVNQYKAATWLPADQSWPWCAAFIDFIVYEAMKACDVKETATFKRPRTAGAWDLENWSKKQDDTTQTRRDPRSDIKAGDIVIFKFSHVGFAVADFDDETNTVKTIEGNTDSSGSREGGGVYLKRRKLSQIKTRIRFTI